MNSASPHSSVPAAFGEGERLPSAIGAGVVVSVVLHAALVAAIIVGTMSGGEEIEEQIEPKMLRFEQVDLLALGEEKPPNQLPRIANPEPEVQPPDEVNLAEPEEPVVDLKKKEEEDKKEDEDARKKKMADALSALHNPNRPTNEEIPEGATTGVVTGNVTDAALANLMGTYQAKLLAEMSKYWNVPSTIPDEEIAGLAGQVEVYVRLSESGHIVSYQFKKNSPNPQFDASIDRLLRRFEVAGGRKLPMPSDDQVKSAVINQGLLITQWEFTGR